MGVFEPIQWWAYLHINGTVQVKRFFDQGDLDEARQSDFVVRVVGPFAVDSREQALAEGARRLGV